MNVSFRRNRRNTFRLLGLCFCLALCLIWMLLPVSGKNMLGDAAGDVKNGAANAVSDVGDAVSDVGDALSDVGGALSDAVSDMGNPSGGAVSDQDGIIGNDAEEMTDSVEDQDGASPMMWVGIAIALAVVAAVIVLIVILVPKKK